jgi:hypothetical protein
MPPVVSFLCSRLRFHWGLDLLEFGGLVGEVLCAVSYIYTLYFCRLFCLYTRADIYSHMCNNVWCYLVSGEHA